MMSSLISRCCPCRKDTAKSEVGSRNISSTNKARSREIDLQLREDRKKRRSEIRLLLLGAGESGKSTFVKQMRIINHVDFTPAERREYRQLIHESLIRGLQILLSSRKELRIPFNGQDIEQQSEMVLAFDAYDSIGPENIGDLAVLARRLWKDTAVKETFRRRSEFQLVDSVGYFLDNLERVSQRTYLPSNQDILYARKTTKEVSEFRVPINKLDFVFLDVGGQRSQRDKWFKLFSQDMTGTLFMVSASEFDQRLREDDRENRLKESAIIFRTIVNNSSFRDTAFILFLNKMDLLEEKIDEKCNDISKIFDEFEDKQEVNRIIANQTDDKFCGDPFSLTDVKLFVLSLFLGQINQRKTSSSNSSAVTFKKAVYHHFTIATNTENIRLVFNSVRDSILRKNLDELMLN